jgi:hypothetical protein
MIKKSKKVLNKSDKIINFLSRNKDNMYKASELSIILFKEKIPNKTLSLLKQLELRRKLIHKRPYWGVKNGKM